MMRREYDPGTGIAAKIAKISSDRTRLQEDRSAGLYESPEDAQWFRNEYARMTREIEELREMPDRTPGMRLVPTGKTVEDEWRECTSNAARREILLGFDVRVALYSKKADRRIIITGANVAEQRLYVQAS